MPMQIPPAAQQFLDRYDTGGPESWQDGRVDWHETGIEIDSCTPGIEQNPNFVKDLYAAATSFGSPYTFEKWMRTGASTEKSAGRGTEIIPSTVATAYLYHKYEAFFHRWDNGEGWLNSARGGTISTAELQKLGGKEVFLQDLAATISDPYDLVLLKHAKFWPSFSDSDEFINEAAKNLLEAKEAPKPVDGTNTPKVSQNTGAGFHRKM